MHAEQKLWSQEVNAQGSRVGLQKWLTRGSSNFDIKFSYEGALLMMTQKLENPSPTSKGTHHKIN